MLHLFLDYGDTKHGRAWKLLQVALPLSHHSRTGIHYISASDMRYHRFLNVQVLEYVYILIYILNVDG